MVIVELGSLTDRELGTDWVVRTKIINCSCKEGHTTVIFHSRKLACLGSAVFLQLMCSVRMCASSS